MQGQYSPHQVEEKWRRKWRKLDVFSPKSDAHARPDDSFCIMIPPPNVTGTLHMGHAFQHTLIDLLIRHQRMLGKPVLWQMGTDHAGIATQMLVARQLLAQGTDPRQMGREAFLEKVHNWVEKSGNTICNQISRMGASVDWSNTRFTLDEHYHKTVLDVFVRLYRQGLIYRSKRLVNWDPQLQTAISDLEVVNREEQGFLYTVRYPLVDGSGNVEIATTRPETILADGAVAISPGDVRYTHLLGKKVWVPLTERQIPIIEDGYVDPEFGTGCVKITPAHDFNDYQVGQRHEMEVINLFTPRAEMNDNAPPAYRGLDRFAARERIVADLRQAGLLVKEEAHIYKRPYGDRSNVVIEPYFTDQWFVAVDKLARRARNAVGEGEISFVPKQWTKVYYNWMDTIGDWCISRQLWWGHRIPAWRDSQGNYYIGHSEAEARSHHGLDDSIALTRDEDVLDTWFSSALWTFATLGWPEHTERLRLFHPTDILVTGFDLIFFWVARMIMFTLHLTDQIPFKQVYVHGLVRDAEGQKMSKSKGNIIDPLNLVDGIDLESLVINRTSNMLQPELAKKIAHQTRQQYPQGIDAYGADALRITFCSLASTGRNIRFDLGRLSGYRNFCNKLWNATRYVLMQVEDFDIDDDYTCGLAEAWLVSHLQRCEAAAAEAIASYRFDLLTSQLYNFTWHSYCDWYVELSKPLLQGADNQAARRGVQRTLLLVLDAQLRLLHPLIPFVTEELWEQIRGYLGKGDVQSLSMQPYPQANKAKIDTRAEQSFDWVMQLIQALRSLRSGNRIAPKELLQVGLLGLDEQGTRLLDEHGALVAKLTNLTSIQKLDAPPDYPCLMCQVQGVRLLVPMHGLVEPASEQRRLKGEQARLEKEIARLRDKLGSNFAERAPAEVVETERTRLVGYQTELASLLEQVQFLGSQV